MRSYENKIDLSLNLFTRFDAMVTGQKKCFQSRLDIFLHSNHSQIVPKLSASRPVNNFLSGFFRKYRKRRSFHIFSAKPNVFLARTTNKLIEAASRIQPLLIKNCLAIKPGS